MSIIENVGTSAQVRSIVKDLDQALSGATGIARVLSETDYTDTQDPEYPVKMLGLADGLNVMVNQLFASMCDLKDKLGFSGTDHDQEWDAEKKAWVRVPTPASDGALGTNDVRL